MKDVYESPRAEVTKLVKEDVMNVSGEDNFGNAGSLFDE